MEKANLPMKKLIKVLDGEIMDLIVDCRVESKNYGKYLTLTLNSNSEAIHVPAGFAHGFQVLSTEAIVMYITDMDYCSVCDRGINSNDFDLLWPIPEKIKSDKDSNLENFDNFDYLSVEAHK